MQKKVVLLSVLGAAALLAAGYAVAAGPIVPISQEELAKAVRAPQPVKEAQLIDPAASRGTKPPVTPEMRCKTRLDAKDVEIQSLKDAKAAKEQEVSALKQRLEQLQAELSRGDDVKVKKIISVLKSVKATESAAVLQRLKKNEALDILGRLDQRTLAKVLPALEPALSTEFVRTSMYPSSSGAGGK